MSFPYRSLPRMIVARMAWSVPEIGRENCCWSSLALYAALLAYIIPRHEPWADEAQAWELAKSLSLKSLFGTYIHYEGSPGLWHALLWMLSRMHVTYSGMHWIAGFIALAAMALLTIAAPFPLLLRLLLPFTYFFAFQYSVVARSYVLFPAILFALACLWPTQASAPSASRLAGWTARKYLCARFCRGAWPRHRPDDRVVPRTEGGARARGILAASALLLIALLGFAAWCIMPAPDAGWVVVAKDLAAHGPLAARSNRLPELDSRMGFQSSHLKTAIAIIYQFAHELGHGLADKFHLGVIVWVLLVWGWMYDGLLRYSLPALFLLGILDPFRTSSITQDYCGYSFSFSGG